MAAFFRLCSQWGLPVCCPSEANWWWIVMRFTATWKTGLLREDPFCSILACGSGNLQILVTVPWRPASLRSCRALALLSLTASGGRVQAVLFLLSATGTLMWLVQRRGTGDITERGGGVVSASDRVKLDRGRFNFPSSSLTLKHIVIPVWTWTIY